MFYVYIVNSNIYNNISYTNLTEIGEFNNVSNSFEIDLAQIKQNYTLNNPYTHSLYINFVIFTLNNHILAEIPVIINYLMPRSIQNFDYSTMNSDGLFSGTAIYTLFFVRVNAT